MSRELIFFKLHGLGNDFVLVDEREEPLLSSHPKRKQIICEIADRKRGVGFDQLLVLKASARVHAILDIYNADGSMAEMCGNGLRAAALYLWHRAKEEAPELVMETAAGDRKAHRLDPVDTDMFIECEMGVPQVKHLPDALKRGVKLGKKVFKPTIVNVGNPHAVVFATPKNKEQLAEWGSLLENHRAFPKRTNVEFVKVRDRHCIEVQVWERGVGITEACGTGAVASAIAAIAQGECESPVEVRFPGGVAEVTWKQGKTPAFLRGHAAEVYDGRWKI